VTNQVSELSESIAEIRWDPETAKIADISFFRTGLRFKCKRCAVFCCKLGGPRMSREDIRRLRLAGYEPDDFLDVAADGRFGVEGGGKSVVKQRENGSCVFLEYDGGNKVYRCSVYEFRPALCRLYPFEFERTGLNKGLLGVIPCCNGLNTCEGVSVGRKMIDELFGTILDLL